MQEPASFFHLFTNKAQMMMMMMMLLLQVLLALTVWSSQSRALEM
jgi:hypothetical protein